MPIRELPCSLASCSLAAAAIKAKSEFTFASSLALSINIETVLERELDMPRVASSRSKKRSVTLHVIHLSESIKGKNFIFKHLKQMFFYQSAL